jgi:hypothetical protein
VTTALAILAFVAGGLVVAAVFMSAVSTVVVPRGVPVRLSRALFLGVRRLFLVRIRFTRSFEDRERILAYYAPLTLVLLPLLWLSLVLVGYTAMFWALGVHPLREAFVTSGSSGLTLGFAAPGDLPETTLAFTEAAVGLALVALLITYLPSMYAAFSRRELLVGLTDTFADTPPSGVTMLERFSRISGLEVLEDRVWQPWLTGFIDIEETHTSLAALPLFRSPQPGRSWVTASGAVLDGASLLASSVDVPRSPPAELCIRSGYLSLRAIAANYGIDFDPDPDPGDPISIVREEFDDALDRLGAAGVPLKPDRDQAWRDFSGWRVNYDTVLLALAGFVQAPYAPWSSDRSPTALHRPPLLRPRTPRRVESRHLWWRRRAG